VKHPVHAFLLLLTILFSNLLIAQYTLGLESNYVGGINKESIYVHHTEVRQEWFNGYQITVNNGYRFKKTPLSIMTKIGYKSLFSKGYTSKSTFHTTTRKLVINAGALYHFKKAFSTGLYFGLENNLDFEDFRAQTTDLFRYSVQGEINYEITKRCTTTLQLYTTIGPNFHHYYLVNPQHQVLVGFKFKIL
jgi:hypothetical protein